MAVFFCPRSYGPGGRKDSGGGTGPGGWMDAGACPAGCGTKFMKIRTVLEI